MQNDNDANNDFFYMEEPAGELLMNDDEILEGAGQETIEAINDIERMA